MDRNEGYKMNFESWNIDIASLSATHASGFKVVVEGDPTSPEGVHPGHFPEGLSAVEQARLVRCGLEAIVKQARMEKREKTKAAYAEQRADHVPTRKVLSFKKKA